MTPAGVTSTFVSSGLNGPHGLAFDTAGNLYVANHRQQHDHQGEPANAGLSGTPTATGTFNFTVTATDSLGATASQAYTVTIP